MQLGVEFPPVSAEWTFFVATFVILVGPLVVERFGLPGIVGVILGGVLVGPSVLDWIPREGVVESLGELGILVLMFLAGLELDLDEFRVNQRAAVTFGALTFSLPFVLGIALALPFGYGLATAMLFGSLWASHTLVAYPIVQEHGLLRDRAVGIAGGGTVMTDTLALAVLAVVAGSVESDARPSVLVLEVGVGLAVLAAFCGFVLPAVTRWVFSGVGQHRGARFLFLLVALTSAALVADRAGIEPIVGAFFAGLALNRLVPARGRLMEQVEFAGGVLLIPFFLLSTGMLVDAAKFGEGRVLLIAALSLGVVFAGKGAAAYVAGKTLGLSRPQSGLLFGLSLAQAAATLAAVTIGVEIGLFDDDLLNATLVVVLVTVLASSIITRRAARSSEPPPVRGDRLADTLLVPVESPDDTVAVRLAARLAMAKGGTVLVSSVASAPGAELTAARELARTAAQEAFSVGAEAATLVRVDASAASALSAIAVEHDVSLVVTSWRRPTLAADVVLGGVGADVVALAEVPVLAVLSGTGEVGRVVVALDREDLGDHRAAERELTLAVAAVAAAATRGNALLLVPDAAFTHTASRLGDDVEVLADRRARQDAARAAVGPDDLLLLPGRTGSSPLPHDAAAIARGVPGTVAVVVRPHAASTLVTGTPLLVGSRRPA